MDSDRVIDDAFNLLNQVRTHPHDAAARLSSTLNQYNQKIFRDKVKTREGQHALRDLINELNHRPPVQRKLQWCFGLHMIADQQAKRLAQHNLVTTQGHESHIPLPERAREFAMVKGRICEVTEFGGESGEQVVEWLLIDDGLTSRKRRLTLLDPAFKYVGVGSYMHETYDVVTVIVLAQDVVSLVAPGKDGYYMKRRPIRPEQINNMVIQTIKQNQRDRINRVPQGGNRTIASMFNLGRRN